MAKDLYLRPRNRGMDPRTKHRLELAAVGGVVALALSLWGASMLFGAPAGATAIATASVTPTAEPTAAPAARAAVPASAEPSVPATTTTAPASVPPSAAPAAVPTPSPDATFVVVIDAGHQAHADLTPEAIGPGSKTKKPAVAGGTSGVSTHAPESRINLEVALRLRKALESRGITVIMVRTTQNVDLPNSKRAKLANAAHAGLLIRLHCDGAKSSSLHGLLTLVPAKNAWTGPIVAASARAGRDIHAAAVKATGAKDRGITPRSDMSGFNWSRVPAVIVEMGVMTNRAEDRALSTAAYQQKLADGMATGIARFAAGK